MKIRIFAILLFGLGLHFPGEAGTEGHGGDPLRLLFEDARSLAADRILRAESCAFGSNVSAEVRDWVVNRKQALADDILQSAHHWVTDQQSTCAFTETKSKSDVTLSFEACRPGIKDVSDALKILVHESVHHFEIVDEHFADQVADAIYTLGSYSACTLPPSENPFDPASCPGNPLTSSEMMGLIPLPNSNQKELGRFQISIRMRTCYSANWCSPWVDARHLKAFYGWKGSMDSIAALSRQGRVKVLLLNNIPFLKYEADGQDWFMFNEVMGSQLTYESSNKPNNTFLALMVGDKMLKDHPPKGWITNSCARQTVTVSQNEKDNLNNDVVTEYELVFLSQFH